LLLFLEDGESKDLWNSSTANIYTVASQRNKNHIK
jgi:hypothetical protein